VKAAKAAMFYISDYITKMNVRTYEMLSLMSRALSNMPDIANSSTKDHAKILLHKCLAQFCHQQQIHAQQSAHYLRGLDDSISSHNTTPMLTLLLLNHIYSQLTSDLKSLNNDNNDDDIEQTSIRIAISSNGHLLESNQIHDYYYRGGSLQDMNFFDFCCCIKLESKGKKLPTDTPESRLGVLHHHDLLPQHPLSETHHLKEHTNHAQGEASSELIPRVIGLSILRTTAGTKYALFVLAHLKPFSINCPLIPKGQTVDQVFENFHFTLNDKQLMKNWDVIHECEDARDAERICKHAAMTSELKTFSDVLKNNGFISPDSIDFDVNASSSKKAKQDFEILKLIISLQQVQWFRENDHIKPQNSSVVDLPIVTDMLLKCWKAAIKEQEVNIKHA
jgi:hypothetical protein